MKLRVLLFCLWALPGALMADPLPIVTSIAPVKTLVERIGGEHVEVQVMVPAGRNPHAYVPTPKQVARFTSAVAFVSGGNTFEKAWQKRIQKINPDLVMIHAAGALATAERSDHSGEKPGTQPDHDHDEHDHADTHDQDNHETEHDHGHHDHADDNHFWTSPSHIKRAISIIYSGLTQLDPARTAYFRQNFEDFEEEIDELIHDLQHTLENLPSRSFLVFHPAWGHFAEDFDLIQLEVEQDGKEPGARALVDLIETAKAEGINTIFVNPGSNLRLTRKVSQALQASVEVVDPLAPDVLDNLRRFAAKISEAYEH